MLYSLTIRQIALIDEVTILFHDGLHVLTGETGAGKSIVVDAVNLVLGGRADRDLIRSGSEKASVEAVFDIPDNPDISSFMEEQGIEYDGRTVTVYREISTGGKNICRICGIILPVSRLKELSPYLLDLHGQNDHYFLTDTDRQLQFLDQTGDAVHREILTRTRNDCLNFLKNHREYAGLVRKNDRREEKMLSLQKSLEELEKAEIKPGEAGYLLDLRKRLAESEKRAEDIRTVLECLGGDEEGPSGLSRIREASDILRSLSSGDPKIKDLGDRCANLFYELEDIAYQLNLFIEDAGCDPETLEKTEQRLEMIHRIERKYGMNADEIAGAAAEMKHEYEELEALADRIREMSADHKKLLASYRQTARTLTESRKRLSSDFEAKMMHELADLGMGNTWFRVCFLENETGKPLMPTEHGDDRIEFMISPNPGEPLKPLSRIASGGELSRLMLAVKTLESAHTGVHSMVFDEIDTGISGRMAQVVAEKMITISRKRQVICVTHLPQIAAAADYHYLVMKSISENRTHTSVTELSKTGRTHELSRMISGADGVNDDSDGYALRLLDAAEEMKKRR